MAKSDSAKIHEISLEGWIALVFAPMPVVFSLLLWLAQLYGFLQDKPLLLILLGLVTSLLLSLLILVVYARFAPFRSLLKWLVYRAHLVGEALLRFTRSKWGYRAIATLFFLTMLIGQWLVFGSISSVALLALNTLLLLCLIALLIDKRRKLRIWEDTFEYGLANWRVDRVVRFGAAIDPFLGNPPPCLRLRPIGSDISLRRAILFRWVDNFSEGIVECDVFLLDNGLVNIMFRANADNTRYYMARLDTRDGCFDSFLEIGPGDAWFQYRGPRSLLTPPKTWVHMRLEVYRDHMKLYRNSLLVSQVHISQFTQRLNEGLVGLFCEVNDVLINNFRLTVFPQ